MWRVILAIAIPSLAQAETVIAQRNLPPRTVVTSDDVSISDIENSRAYSTIDSVVGKETKIAIYAGQPLLYNNTVNPIIVQRNAVVKIIYREGPLTIQADGRALGNGAAGDTIRVMNLSSRSIISGIADESGTIIMGSGK